MEIRPKITVLLILVLGGLQIISLSRQVIDLLSAGDRLTEAEQKLEQVKKENEDLRRQLSYDQSPEYLEKQAREKLNRARPDETVVVIPDELINVYTVDEKPRPTPTPEPPNWKQWRQAFFNG